MFITLKKSIKTVKIVRDSCRKIYFFIFLVFRNDKYEPSIQDLVLL